MSKRILSLVLTLALVLGSFSMAFADTTATTKATNTAVSPAEKIAELQRLGFIKGDDSGNLKLEDPIKRSETAIIVSKAVVSGGNTDMEAVEKEIELSRYQSRFSDVPTSYRSNPYINVAVQKAIVNGYPDNTFRPDRDIKYSEVITMMVGILGEKPTPGVKYPDNYIGKARELGLLEGINVNYVGQAQRQGVFELLYNTITNNKVGNYNIDKVLVLENNRVESIGANELVVEVIKEVQRANFVNDSRNSGDKDARRGQQLRITVPSEVGDVENLLGKVVDLSYDSKNVNKAVAIKLDSTYAYVSGEITLEEKKLEVDGKTYTVSKDERYNTYNDERIFNTYINNQAFSYDDALKESKKADKALDFGNVTIKNGKVLFIDAFAFNDIAPVKEVKENGKKTEVTVYNDINDGGIKKIELEKEKIVSFKDGSFKQINKEDIAKLNVIHVGEDTKGNKAVVVRQDAQVNGTYQKVVEYKEKTVVVLDGKEYKILTAPAKKPVYAYDSKEFKTLYANTASNVLKEFKNEKATILQDINGDLQYLGSEIEFGEFVSLVDRIVGKEARLLKADDSKSDYSTTLDSKLGSASTGHQSLQSYDKGDIVFVAADKNNIDTMKKLSYDTKGKNVRSIDKDLRFIDVDSTEYRTLDRTNVFVRTLTAGGNIDKMYATTLANIEKNAKDEITKGNVEAIVITDEDYNNMDPRRTFDKGTVGAKKIANTIVFTVINLKSDLNTEIVELTSVSNRYEEIEVKLADGTNKTYKVEKDSKAYDSLKANVVAGDIIELGMTKTDDKIVKEIKLEIAKNASGQEITYYNERTKEVTISGLGTLYLTKDTANFVKGGLEKGKFVKVSTSGDYVKAIASRNRGTGSETVAGTVTYINVAENLIEVDNKVLSLDTRVRLLDANGKTLAIGKDEVVRALKVKDILSNITKTNDVATELRLAKVNDNVEQPSAELIKAREELNKRLVELKALSTDTTKYEEDSIKAVQNAITKLTGVKDSSDVKVINDAVASVKDVKLVDKIVTPGENTIKGKFALSVFGLNYVEFPMPAGQTQITSVKINDTATTKFSVDGSNGKVILGNLQNDKVTVVIGATEYTIVR